MSKNKIIRDPSPAFVSPDGFSWEEGQIDKAIAAFRKAVNTVSGIGISEIRARDIMVELWHNGFVVRPEGERKWPLPDEHKIDVEVVP